MNRRIALTAAFSCAVALTTFAQTPGLADMNTRLRAEETSNSKVMWIMHEITDVHGPRLTGSPGLREAQGARSPGHPAPGASLTSPPSPSRRTFRWA
jgi:carboxypeptidase Q